MNPSHFKKLENLYLGAPINTELFPSTCCTIDKGKAEIEIEIDSKYFHALGAIHGSIYFKLLDDASYFAMSSMVTDYFLLTRTFELEFLKPVRSGRLKAVGKIRVLKEHCMEATAQLYDTSNNLVGVGNGSFAKSNQKLIDTKGYQ
ncbi:MAG: PaaI family thioesterase [Flavicella sp.]